MKKSILLCTFLLSGLATFAQENVTKAKSFWDDPMNDPMLPLYLVTFFVFVVILLVATVAIYIIRVLNFLTIEAQKTQAEQLGIPYTPKQGWWDSFMQRMNASVPIEQEKDIELHHSYDGIKELDNHLPPWWKYLFYGTIAWSAVYIVVYHFSNTLPLQLNEYENEVAMAEEQARKFKASQPQEAIDENSLTFSEDKALIEKGRSVFMDNNCGSCHRNDGGGNSIGPNLTDAYWLHGGDIKNVFNTVKNGVVEKGMPAWGRSLSPQKVRDVSFYIKSLQGSNPPNAKAPQGEIFKEVILKSDSTQTRASL